MSKALKKWVDLLAEKEAQGRKISIQNEDTEVKVTSISKNSKLQSKINRLKSYKIFGIFVYFLNYRKDQTEKNKIVPMEETIISGKKENEALLQENSDTVAPNLSLKDPSKDLEMDELLREEEEKRKEKELQHRLEDQKQKDELLNDIKSLINDAKKTILDV